MYIVCSDLEGVFVPEIWINVALQTGIEELKLTTRDISDYNILMNKRLSILDKHGLTLDDIQNVIARITPLPGAVEFVNWLRERTQLIVVSDTFSEFAAPLMKQLGWPTLFCHNLTTDGSGRIIQYNLRQKDAKKKSVESLQSLGYKVIAIGDSYNDLNMLRQAEEGILFNPPTNIATENKDLQVVTSYDELKAVLNKVL
jgi:phosphoserine / homoserine phosphotransferase